MSKRPRSFEQYYQKTQTFSGWAALAVILLFLLGIAFVVAVGLAFVLLLVFGINSTIHDGPQFWSILWIIIGGLGILGWYRAVLRRG